MKTKLITALRLAATAIETRSFAYDYARNTTCNCGVLYCAIAGKSAEDLRLKLPRVGNPTNWRKLAGEHCPITGVPTNEIFRTLTETGLTAQDIGELEECGNEKVLSRLNVKLAPAPKNMLEKWLNRMGKNRTFAHYRDRDFVVKYMRAWADLLVEDGRLDVISPSKELQTA